MTRTKLPSQNKMWCFVTFGDTSVRVVENEFVVGKDLFPGLCRRHVVLRRGKEEGHSVDVELTCEDGGAAFISGEQLMKGPATCWIGGWLKVVESEAKFRLNVSVTKHLPAHEIEFLEVLGVGSQAEVKKCRYKNVVRAAKIFHKSTKLAGRTVAEALINEGERERDMLIELRHPLLVSLHAVFETPFHLICVIDFCNGGDLCDLINSGELAELSEKRRVIQMMCEAVAFLHRHHVGHRDIKPSNFLVDKDELGKVETRVCFVRF
jgi:tRNA A-37 threonylcarbamoyl transferase component Bud32